MKTKIFMVLVFIFVCSIGLSRSQTSEQQLSESKSVAKPNHLDLSDEIIQQRIEMFLLKNYQQNHDEVKITCEQIPKQLLVDPVDWEVKVKSKYGDVKNGSNLLDVTVFSKKNIYKKFVANAKLQTYDDIVIAKRMLQRGQKITEEDVLLQHTETTNFKRDYFTMTKDVTGLQTKKIIGEGNPIFTQMVELPDIIRRGDIIKIVVRLKNMKVTATGKALENGRRGQTIRVQNNSTGKKMAGEIVNEKTVLVEL